jgi:serine/threonine protein kinase
MDAYKIIHRIGEGISGCVYKVKRIENDNEFAIKKLPIDLEEGISMFSVREIKALKKLKSSFITELHDVFIEDNSVFLVLEFLPFSLAHLISKNFIFSPDVFESIVFQIFQAVGFIHSKGMIHRDLKPSAILLDSNCFVKLSNFGQSVLQDESMTNKVSSLHYRAPELLLGDFEYTNKIDSWSIGCILIEITTGQAPFKASDEISQCKLIFKSLGVPDCEYPWNELFNIQQFAQIESIDQILQNKFGNLFEERMLLVIKELFQINKVRRLSVENALKLPIVKRGSGIKATIHLTEP